MDNPHKPRPETTVVDVRDMVVAHQAFRREFRLAPRAVDRVAGGNRRQVRRVAKHLRFLIVSLEHHHAGEDRLLWPKLRHRVPSEFDVAVTAMEDQHEVIQEALDAVKARLPGWIAGAAIGDRALLSQALTRLSAVLDEHLDAEEDRILPLAATHLDEAEWQALERDGIDSLPKSQAAFAFGSLMYEGDPEVIGLMLGRAPAAARLLMPSLAPRAYARRARRLYGTPTP